MGSGEISKSNCTGNTQNVNMKYNIIVGMFEAKEGLIFMLLHV